MDKRMIKQIKFMNDTGLTLLELMVALVILAIALGIAAPNVMAWLPNYRIKACCRELYSHLQQAKMEACKRNFNVVVTFFPGTYAPQGSIGSYQVFVDNGAGGGTANDNVRNGSEPLLAQVTMPKNVSLYRTTLGGNKTGFTPMGMPISSGVIELRNNKSRYYRIALSISGNIKLETSNDGATWK